MTDPLDLERAAAWAVSEEGKAAVREAVEKSERTIEALRKARKVSWQKMMEPMDR